MDSMIDKARALIFDCDGTLADSAPLYARVIAEAFAHTGVMMEPDWYFARHGLSAAMLMDEFDMAFEVRIDRHAAVSAMRDLYKAGLVDLKELTAVADIARRYHGHKAMAVASAGPAEIVLPTLESLNLRLLFDTVVTIEDTGKAKPDPSLFLEAARRLNVTPEQCLVFEDSPQGIKAALNAGMPVIDIATLVN